MNESSSYSFVPVHLLNWPKLCLISTICQVTSENYKEVFSFWQPCPQVMPFFGDEAVNWNRVELQGHLCERLAIRGGSTCLHRLKGSTFEKMQLDWLFAMIYIFECLAVVLNMLNDQCHWVGRDPELIHFFSSRFFFPLLFSAQPVAMGQPLDPLRGLSAHLNEVVGVFFFRTMIPPWEYGVIILFFLSCCFDLEHLAQVFQVQDGKEGSNDINCP